MNDIVLTDNSHFISQNYSWNKKVKFFHFAALTLDNFLSFKMFLKSFKIFVKIWRKKVFRNLKNIIL